MCACVCVVAFVCVCVAGEYGAKYVNARPALRSIELGTQRGVQCGVSQSTSVAWWGRGRKKHSGSFPFVPEEKQGKEFSRYERQLGCEVNRANPH